MWLIFAFIASFVTNSTALQCNQPSSDGSQGKCSGDLCVIRYRGSTILDQGCTFGGNYASLRGYCVRHEDVTECFCSTSDFCNIIAVANSSIMTTLNANKCHVGTSNQCVGSSCVMSFGEREAFYCDNTTESVIYRANPDAYISADVSIESRSNGFPDATLVPSIGVSSKTAYGRCYTENCWNATYTTRVKAIMDKNVSISCFIDVVNKKYCIGDYCYITQTKINETEEIYDRGCFIADGYVIPQSSMISAAGMDHYIDRTSIYCKDQNCNENFDSAWNSIGKPFAAYISSSSTPSFVLVIIVFPLTSLYMS